MKKFFIFIIIIGLFVCLGRFNKMNHSDIESQPIYSSLTIYEQQAKIEQQIENEYLQSDYTLDNPYLIHNPYQNSPLSFLIKFTTPKAAKIEVHVAGKTTNTDLTYSYDTLTIHHSIPVIGLYPDYENQVTLTAIFEDGTTETSSITIQTPSLSKQQIQTKVTLNSSPSENLNLYLINDDFYTYLIDSSGDIRFAQDSTSGSLALLRNGNFLTYNMPYFYYYQVMLEEIDILGRVHQTYYIPGAGHHSLYELNNGNVLINSSDKTKEAFIEDVIYILNRKDGSLLETINLRDYLDITRFEGTLPQYVNESTNDWFHLNYAMLDEQDQTVIASGRSQSMVVKIDPKATELKWILGAHDDVEEPLQPYLLTPIGDLTWPFAQHSAKVLPDLDENPDTTDLILLDNHVDIGVFPRNKYPDLNQYSRGVHYRINETEMTVEQLFEFGPQLETDVLSTIISEIDYIPDETSFLILFGFVSSADQTGGKLFEVDAFDATNIHFSLELLGNGTNHIYTAQKINLDELNLVASTTDDTTNSLGHHNLNLFKTSAMTSDEYAVTHPFDFLISTLTLKDRILSLKGFIKNYSSNDEVKLVLKNEEGVNYEFSVSAFDIHQVVEESELPSVTSKSLKKLFKKQNLYRFTDFTDLTDLPNGVYQLMIVHTKDNKQSVYDSNYSIHIE